MTRNGLVTHIFIARERGEPMVAVTAVCAVAGQGLERDRYFRRTGPRSDRFNRIAEVTLVEREVLEALRRDYGIALDPRDTRRNIITEGIALNSLVGCEFRVGEAILRGAALCELISSKQRRKASSGRSPIAAGYEPKFS